MYIALSWLLLRYWRWLVKKELCNHEMGNLFSKYLEVCNFILRYWLPILLCFSAVFSFSSILYWFLSQKRMHLCTKQYFIFAWWIGIGDLFFVCDFAVFLCINVRHNYVKRLTLSNIKEKFAPNFLNNHDCAPNWNYKTIKRAKWNLLTIENLILTKMLPYHASNSPKQRLDRNLWTPQI